jgi:benzoylformate decarboxylase
MAVGLDELATLLGEGRVGIVAGDEVADADAQADLAAVAEAIGAPVHGAPLHARAVFDPRHRLWAGMLAPSAAAIRQTLSAYDRVLLVGGQAFLVYPYSPGSPIPEGVELLHLTPDAGQLGRAHPVVLGLVGGIKPSLVGLLAQLPPRAAAGDDGRRRDEIERLEATALDRYGPTPGHPMAAAHALVRAIPPGTPVVDEAITTGVYVRGFHHRAVEDGYYFCKGGGLGWGMPAACGVSLARDRSPVLCAVGDGSAMYSPQALWTAAREHLPVVFAVVDNGQYKILKDYLRGMGGVSATTGRFVAMDLEPAVDFVGLARSMGVDAGRVDAVADIGEHVRTAFERGGPHLLHIPITA